MLIRDESERSPRPSGCVQDYIKGIREYSAYHAISHLIEVMARRVEDRRSEAAFSSGCTVK